MSEDRFLEVGDGNGDWLPIGTVGNIEDLGPAPDKRKVLVVFDEANGVTAEAWADLAGFEFEVVAMDDERVKGIDMPFGFSATFSMEINEVDREKMLAMFGPPQIPLATSIGYVESVDGVGCFGAKRGKKGKYKKDWHR